MKNIPEDMYFDKELPLYLGPHLPWTLYGVKGLYFDDREPELDKMPLLVGRMASSIKGHRINGNQIKKICNELGLGERIDPMVSELKACGILSHKLSSLTEVSRAGAPLYEINPSLLVE